MITPQSNRLRRARHLVVAAVVGAFSLGLSLQSCGEPPHMQGEERPDVPPRMQGKGQPEMPPPHKRLSQEELKANLTKFILSNVELSDYERQTILPAFFEMKARQHELRRSNRHIARSVETEPLDSIECELKLKAILDQSQEAFQARKKFVEDVRKKGVSPRKILEVIAADDRAARDMFRRMTKDKGDK